MAEAEKEAQQNAEAQAEEISVLDQVVGATKQTERSRAEDLVRTLTREAMAGVVTWDRGVGKSITEAVSKIDQIISKQLAAVMHQEKFQKLEGSWRGFHHLVMNSETGSALKIKVLNVSKRDLFKDLDKAAEFDQSQTFTKLYENEFGMAGGEPFGTLVGDYEFTNHPDDIDTLTKMSSVAAAAFCPFIAAASPKLFGFDDYTELSKPRDLEKIFSSVEYAKWNSFRDSEDSRFITLTMPRTIARLPYGSETKPVEEFNFEEVALGSDGKGVTVPHDQYCWMNTSYVAGVKMTEAFSKYGWCTAIRGVEGGGKVEGLNTHIVRSDDGDLDMKCPTEINITDRREAELSKLGFLPLVHFKNNDYAAFIGGQTTQRPKKYDKANATANAAISARLPYMMATSRFAHYLKVMARDKVGSFMEAEDCEKWLNNWISRYVLEGSGHSAEKKAQYPLAAARVEVKEVPGAPGSYNAIAWMQPWLQMEELTTSLRMVARIPERSA